MNTPKLTPAERAWMTELNQLGEAKGLEGFPMNAVTFEWNCFIEDYRAGLTAREAIERQEHAVKTRNA